MAQAFKPSPQLGLAGKQDWSPAEADAFVQGTVGKSAEPFMRDAVARADGRLRKTIFASLDTSTGPSSRQIVESAPMRILSPKHRKSERLHSGFRAKRGENNGSVEHKQRVCQKSL